MAAKTPRAITDMSTLSRVIYDPDTTPPPVPSGLIATAISSSRIDLAWLPSIDTGGSGTVGYFVYRNGAQIATASALAYSDTGLAPSTTYQYQLAAVDGAGNVSALCTAVAGATQAIVGPPVFVPLQPAAAFIGIAGQQTYTDPTQQAAIGFFDAFIMGGAWEGWSSTGRDRETIVMAIKNGSTALLKTKVFVYQKLNVVQQDANDAYPTYTAEVNARNWKVYNNGSSGTLTVPAEGAASNLVNYTTFAGTNPSGEFAYDFGAKYSYYKYLTKAKSDPRFAALNAGLASPSLDGIFQDNFLCNPQVNGDFNRDGTTDIQGFPCAATPWLQAGQLKYCQTMRLLAPTKYVYANFGDYGWAAPGVMNEALDGGLCESFFGKSWSWETQLDFPTTLSYYYRALDTAINPNLVMLGGSWPDTNPDGSALPRLPTAGGFPPLNTQWQWARYIIGTARLGEGMSALNRYSQGYSADLAALDRYDEYGGIAGLPRGWLGNPLATSVGLRPTTPRILKGPIGVYVREYDNGVVAVNPKGNGTQTLTSTDLPGGLKFLLGTQDPVRNSGATFTSISIPERDALFLRRILGTPAFLQNFDALATGGSGGFNSYDCTVDVTRAFSGTKSGKISISSGGFTAGVAQLLSGTTPGQGDEVWLRLRTFFPTGFSFASNPHLKFLRIDTGAPPAGHGAHIDWYISAVDAQHPSGYFNFIYEGVQSWLFASDATLPTGIVLNQWQTWEVYYKLHSVASSSILRLWRDGTLICDTSANIPAGVGQRATLSNSTTIIGNLQGNMAQGFMHVTYWNGGAPQNQSWWVDDFTIYTSLTGRPTNADAAGNTFIGP